MRVERVRVLRALRTPGGPDAAAWASGLADEPWFAGSELIKSEGGSWVRRATLLGREVVVKGQALAGTADRVKAAVGWSRADRQWRGAAWLAMKSIACAGVLARARADIGGTDTDLLVMERVEGPTLLRVMADAGSMPVRAQHRLASAVGTQVRIMLDAAGYNRDHKPSNLLVHSARGPVVLDTVAVRCGPWTRVARGGERMLASLVIEPTGCGVLPRRPLLWRGLLAAMCGSATPRADAKAMWKRIGEAVARHGDASPRVNPLASLHATPENSEGMPRNE